jgi:hypothetical protein
VSRVPVERQDVDLSRRLGYTKALVTYSQHTWFIVHGSWELRTKN